MTITIQCAREECSNVFEVDATAESARCPACGRKHSLDNVTGQDDGTPVTVGERDATGDGGAATGADVTVSGSDLATNDLVVEIRIHLEPREGR